MVIVRYADDVVAGFEHEADASRFLEAMRARFETFALSLHPDKTRLLECGRHAAARRQQRGLGKPETFTFLGFTFICGKTRSGKFLLKRTSRGDRVRARLAEVKEELRHRRHQPIPEQGKWLAQVVAGFFNYHAVPINFAALHAFRDHVRDLWRRSLRRRSQRNLTTYERVKKLADDWLPRQRILHPWPRDRFAVKHPRCEPYAGIPPIRFCAGGRSVMDVPTAIPRHIRECGNPSCGVVSLNVTRRTLRPEVSGQAGARFQRKLDRKRGNKALFTSISASLFSHCHRVFPTTRRQMPNFRLVTENPFG